MVRREKGKLYIRQIVTILPFLFIVYGCSTRRLVFTPTSQHTLSQSVNQAYKSPTKINVLSTPSLTVEKTTQGDSSTPVPTKVTLTVSPLPAFTFTPTYRPTRTYIPSRTHENIRPLSPTPTMDYSENQKALGWIAFANKGTGGNGIDIIHADGSGHLNLTGVNVYQYIYNQPAWSPDGQ